MVNFVYQLLGNATTESTIDYNGTLSTYFDNNTSLESNHTSLDNETTIVSPTDANSSASVSEVTRPENASSTKIISTNATTLKSSASVEIVTTITPKSTEQTTIHEFTSATSLR